MNNKSLLHCLEMTFFGMLLSSNVMKVLFFNDIFLFTCVPFFSERTQNFKGLDLCWQKIHAFVQYYSLVNTVCSFIFSSKVLTLWTLVYMEIPDVKTILFQNWPLHSIVNNFESNNWFQPGKLLTIVLKSNVKNQSFHNSHILLLFVASESVSECKK